MLHSATVYVSPSSLSVVCGHITQVYSAFACCHEFHCVQFTVNSVWLSHIKFIMRCDYPWVAYGKSPTLDSFTLALPLLPARCSWNGSTYGHSSCVLCLIHDFYSVSFGILRIIQWKTSLSLSNLNGVWEMIAWKTVFFLLLSLRTKCVCALLISPHRFRC